MGYAFGALYQFICNLRHPEVYTAIIIVISVLLVMTMRIKTIGNSIVIVNFISNCHYTINPMN